MTNRDHTTAASASVWRDLRLEAQRVSKKEPFLAPLIRRWLSGPEDMSNALAILLADLLATDDLDKDTCRILFAEQLSGAPDVIEAMAKDLIAVKSRDPSCATYVHAFLNYKGFQALQGYRISNRFWTQERGELAAWISNRVSAVLGPDVHPAAHLGAGIMLDHGSGLVIGETAVVQDDVTILQNVTLGGTGKEQGDRHPKVRRGVMIGAGANIIGNIEIGAFSIVGAGSVVLKDVPPHCTMAGAPAQIVRIHEEVSVVSDGMKADV